MSKLINADNYADHIRADALTKAQREFADRTDYALKKEPEVDAIPTAYIHMLITDPHNAGDKSRVLSWLLRKWEEEKNGHN